jgi:predicted transcriptional regulator
MNQREKEEQRQLWIARLCDLEESSMTQEDWCRSHNIPYSTLRYWISKLKKESEIESRETNWLKVDMSTGNEIATVRIPEAANTIGGINIRFGEFTVELQNGCDPQRVFEVLRMLKAL